MKLPKPVEGIYPRHARSCPAKGWDKEGVCKCAPTFQASVWSKRDGKRIPKTFDTLAAAKGWRSDAGKLLRDGKMRAPTPETIRQAGEALIAGMRDGSVRKRGGAIYKPSVIRSYESSLERHVYPELGAHKTADVLFPDLQDFVDRLARAGLDGQTIRNTVNPLRVIYRKARYQIPVNPTTGLEIPAGRNKPKRAAPAEDVAARLAALSGNDRAIWATDFYAAPRSGELQALRVEHFELFPEGRWGLIHVHDGWDKEEGRIDPKSKAGVRTIPICEQLYDILAPHLAGRTGLAFGQGETPFSYNAVRDRAARVWKAAGLEPFNLQLHEGRHTCKTLMAAAGIPPDRRDRYLGHANNSVAGRYEHQLEHQYLDDAKTFAEYLRRADTPTRVEQVRDNCATVSDSSQRFPAVPSGTNEDSPVVVDLAGNLRRYADSGYWSGGGGI